jgi:endonuclease/exonuclease/phosphatase family metal-dependent hydrolase
MAGILNVMTFNVRGIHDDGANGWPQRAALNVKVIRRCRPDLIGVQEAQSGNLETYAAELPEYACEPGPLSIRQTERYHRVPIYWRAERFECLGSGSFYLSETPDEWSLSWGARLVRAVNWVRLRCRETGLTFIHLNTHLDHEIEQARVNSAQLIVGCLETIREDGLPVIVTGDFNAVPTSKAYQTFINSGYRDTFTEAGHTDAEGLNTFHGFKGEDFAFSNYRIDWILVGADGAGQLNTRSCDILRDAQPPLYPSDHYPVLATLGIA